MKYLRRIALLMRMVEKSGIVDTIQLAIWTIFLLGLVIKLMPVFFHH